MDGIERLPLPCALFALGAFLFVISTRLISAPASGTILLLRWSIFSVSDDRRCREMGLGYQLFLHLGSIALGSGGIEDPQAIESALEEIVKGGRR